MQASASDPVDPEAATFVDAAATTGVGIALVLFLAPPSGGPGLSGPEVGYLTAQIKTVGHTRVGDTLLDADDRAGDLLPGYQEAKPMVFAGLYPTDSDQYEGLRDALERLVLNDGSLHYEPESSTALGFGFRCGFLGLLHMEIVQERLEREYHLDLITSAPTVVYEVARTDGEVVYVDNPSKLPPSNEIDQIREPIIVANILVPPDHVGSVLKLCNDKRGAQKKMLYLGTQVSLQYELPLAEVVLDFDYWGILPR